VREIVERYIDAWERADVDAIVSMLTDDAIIAMPPRPAWFCGTRAVRVFLAARPFAEGRRFRALRVHANGQVAIASYPQSPAAPGPHAALHLLTLDARGRIEAITAFLADEMLAPLGLPDAPV
jgi:RNA polymerase sigma-70 factor (ECF subfamily)